VFYSAVFRYAGLGGLYRATADQTPTNKAKKKADRRATKPPPLHTAGIVNHRMARQVAIVLRDRFCGAKVHQ
jgi:hypothetical protein